MTFPGLFAAGVGRGEMLINGAIPWNVEIRGGASEVDADLAAARVTGFSLTGGANHIGVRRPAEGTVPLRIRGGASRVTLLRPAAVPVRIHVNGGLSRLSIDGRQLGSTGRPRHAGQPRLRPGDRPLRAGGQRRRQQDLGGGPLILRAMRPAGGSGDHAVS